MLFRRAVIRPDERYLTTEPRDNLRKVAERTSHFPDFGRCGFR